MKYALYWVSCLLLALGGCGQKSPSDPARLTEPALLTEPASAETAQKLRADWAKHHQVTEIETNSLGMKLVLIPPGVFQMGSSDDDIDRASQQTFMPVRFLASEQPRHAVRIQRPYYLGVHEVTRGQFARFVQEAKYEPDSDRHGAYGFDEDHQVARKPEYSWKNPGFPQADDHPVLNVSWNDAVAFCEWLSEKERKRYRLPTEAEWEYVAQAGVEGTFFSGDSPDDLARFGNVADASLKQEIPTWSDAIDDDDGHPFTAPVGQFPANVLGVHDLCGNVNEWCADWFQKDYYNNSPAADPPGPPDGEMRVARGGCWNNEVVFYRPAVRGRGTPTMAGPGIGFRVAMSLNDDR